MEQEKPDWFRQEVKADRDKFEHIRETVKKRGLETVCEAASCPNIDECWSQEGTATFMIMGDTCTRACSFCDVDTGFPGEDDLDSLEPVKLASAIEDLGLDYVVITSVDRDDLPDQGSEHFANCIRAVKDKCPDTIIEVLIPDFQGDKECLKTIIRAEPDVISHNLETTRNLQEEVRDPRAGYYQSLSVLENVKKLSTGIFTKSSLMLGFGEEDEAVLKAMEDLRGAGVDILTLGQYLQPSESHHEIEEYVKPEKFDEFKQEAEKKGFLYTASGPKVRSSYRAGEFFIENAIEENVEPDKIND